MKHNCIQICIKQRKIYLKKEEELRNRESGNPCTYLFEELGIKFTSGSKVDYKPMLKCDLTANTDSFYNAYLTGAVLNGEFCKFTVK